MVGNGDTRRVDKPILQRIDSSEYEHILPGRRYALPTNIG